MEKATAGRVRELVDQDLDWKYLLQIAKRGATVQLLHWIFARRVPKAFLCTCRIT